MGRNNIGSVWILIVVVILITVITLFSVKESFNGFTEEGLALACRETPNMPGCTNVLNVQGKMFFEDVTGSTNPNGTNNSDPYYLEKVIVGGNRSSLRLTINDDADESFEIHGNSCSSHGGCGGPGSKAHRMRADGSTAHKGAVVAGHSETAMDVWGFNHGVHTRNPNGQWSHLGWADGRNYIRGPTHFSDNICIGSTCIDEKKLKSIINFWETQQENGRLFPPIAMDSETMVVSGQAYGNGTYRITGSSNFHGSQYQAHASFNSSHHGWVSTSTRTYSNSVHSGNHSTNGIRGEWIQIELPYSVSIKTIWHKPYSPGSYNVVVFGHNGSNWINLGSYKADVGSDKYHSIYNNNSYRYYRLVVDRHFYDSQWPYVIMGHVRLRS
jgi:hypothetical protein